MAGTLDDRDAEWFGEYEILRLLASSPRCDTLLARAHGPCGFRRTVLLKRCPTPGDERAAQELAREARVLACVSGPCVVQLYGFSRVEDHPALALEYVPGPSLAEAAGELRTVRDEVILYIGHALFSGLSAAHHARIPETGEIAPIVHRDVHPGNVRLSWTGDVKVTGFATAKVLVGADSTRPGRPYRTHGYMAPEQVLDEVVSVRTDVYSAALVLYELLSRRRAFPVDAMPELELLKAMAYPALPPLVSLRPQLHRALCNAIDLALAPDPDARRVSASDLAEILASMLDLRSARRVCVEALAPMRAERASGTGPRVPRAAVSAELPSEPDRTESFRFADVPVTPSERPATFSLRPTTTSLRPKRSIRRRRWATLSAATLATVAVWLLALQPLALLFRAPKPVAGTAPRAVSAMSAMSGLDAAPRPSAATDARPPVTSPSGAPPAAPPPPPVPTTGTLTTPARATGHRIYVDGHVVGEGQRSFEVACGARLVRVGSADPGQRIVVPCGGSVAVP